MDDLKQVIDDAQEWALDEIKKNGLPSLINFDKSNEKGQELAEELGADKDIVMIGTILMDIKLGQALKEGRIQEHIKIGSDSVKEFLSDKDISEDARSKILNCVGSHHGWKYSSKEAEICVNADCYRFIFPKNVFVFIVDNVKEGMTFEESIKFAQSKLEEKYKVLSINSCKEELEEYYQMFKKLFEVSG